MNISKHITFYMKKQHHIYPQGSGHRTAPISHDLVAIFSVSRYIILSSPTHVPLRSRNPLKKVQDYYFKKAKKERFAARSVYKLEEIDRKYRLTSPGILVCDIGCAPGSWSQYLLQRIGDGRVVGIDIRNNVSVSGGRFRYVKADLFHLDQDFLEEYGGRFDLITSDAAPSTSGDKFADRQRSLDIVRSVFGTARRVLKPRGSVLAKILQGEDTHGFVRELRREYADIQLFKPKGSRKESSELFIIALHRREFDASK
jgi:23S rRNA (uridine2552-2'-O)-methyltransferase